LGAQDLPNGQAPEEFPPQGNLSPFVISEWAATAPAASITRINIAVFQFFQPPEPDEQHSPPEPDESEQLSFCCALSSFVSIFFPKTNVYSIFFHNDIIVIITSFLKDLFVPFSFSSQSQPNSISGYYNRNNQIWQEIVWRRM
jgi:hypothetical protein